MSLVALPPPAHPVPLDSDVAERYMRELVVLIEEVRRRARNLGLDEAALGELQAPFALRCDAFLWRAHRLLRSRDALERLRGLILDELAIAADKPDPFEQGAAAAYNFVLSEWPVSERGP